MKHKEVPTITLKVTTLEQFVPILDLSELNQGIENIVNQYPDSKPTEIKFDKCKHLWLEDKPLVSEQIKKYVQKKLNKIRNKTR